MTRRLPCRCRQIRFTWSIAFTCVIYIPFQCYILSITLQLKAEFPPKPWCRTNWIVLIGHANSRMYWESETIDFLNFAEFSFSRCGCIFILIRPHFEYCVQVWRTVMELENCQELKLAQCRLLKSQRTFLVVYKFLVFYVCYSSCFCMCGHFVVDLRSCNVTYLLKLKLSVLYHPPHL